MGYPMKVRTNYNISTGLGVVIILVIIAIALIGSLSLFRSLQARQPQDPTNRDITLLEAGLSRNKNIPQYQVKLGFAYYTKALKLKDKDQKRMYFQKALARYKVAQQLNPNIATTWYNIGLCYEQLEDYENAIKTYEKLYEVEGGYNLATERLGVLYMKTGEIDKAIERLEKAVEVVPTASNFKYELAQAYEKKGRIDEAIKLLKDALKSYPDYKEAKEMLERLEKSGKK